MVNFYQKQPDGSLRGPIDWSLFLGWEGEPLISPPIYLPVSFANTGIPYTPQTPKAPTVSATLTSRSTANVSWTPAEGAVGPAILQWDVESRISIDDGATYGAWTAVTGSPYAHDVFGILSLTVPTHTAPEERIQFRVRGENADGLGDYSSTFEVQWLGVVTNPPNPPRTLVVTNITSTSVKLSWTASVGAATDGGTKYGIWQGNVNLNIDIDPNAVSFVWSPLTPGTDYLNINIRRFNAGGWSGGTNWADFKTIRTARVTVDDPVMGQSVPDGVPAYRTQIDAVRVYDFPDTINRFNTYAPRVIAQTDGGHNPTATSLPGDLETELITFYEGAGSSARRSCEYHFAIGNEIDNNTGYTSGNLPQGFIDNMAACFDVITQSPAGVRRFPKASLWVDMTGNQIRTGGSGTRFLPIARYLHGMCCSAYPAGRTISATNPLIEYDPAGYPTGSVWSGNARNKYGYYIDPIFNALHTWRTTGGPGGTDISDQLNMYATWEVGIPIHHSLDGDVSPWVRSGADATDLTQKPRYLVGGAKVTGPADHQYNFEGFLPYIAKKCDDEDVSMREQLYWNQQSNVHIPNKFQADHGLTPIDSQDAWYMWSIGFRLADI